VTQPDQQILDLVECLDCGGGIVDSGREGLDRDIDEQAQRIFRVLLESTFRPQGIARISACSDMGRHAP
jgi:hypothetical protein